MHLKNVPKTLLLLLICAALAASVALAQDAGPGDPLSDEETLALLDDTGANVYPLSAITESPPTLQNITPTSARLNWVGTIPTGCLLVYGETPDFGRASQDPDMAGAAIIDHNPVMVGLQPDTEYFYRLQGSDEAGNLYISPTFSFRTPPESTEGSANLLNPVNGATVTEVSSNFGGQPTEGSTWGAANAFDDDPNTAWSSDGDGDEAYVVVELGQRSHITRIRFWTRTMSNDTAQIFSFTVTTDSGDVYGPFELPDPDQAYEFDVDFEAQSLRFDVVDSNGGNTGAVSIAAFGEPVE